MPLEWRRGREGGNVKGTGIGKGEQERRGFSGMGGVEGKRRLWSTMLMAGIALTQR